MNSQDFADWQRHPMTQRVFAEINSRIADGTFELSTSAGLNPISDSRKVGVIQGLRELLDMSFQETEQE